jgi:hypothetical protein
MKTSGIFAIFIAASVASVACGATEKASIVVKAADFERFTDLSGWREDDREVWAAFAREASDGLAVAVGRLVPGGTLELLFTEFDRAGDVQPWRNRSFDDIRYVESFYPPRVDFAYVVRDAAGVVVAEGQARLRDNSFLLTTNPLRSSDDFYYEVEMLRDWVRVNLGRQIGARHS